MFLKLFFVNFLIIFFFCGIVELQSGSFGKLNKRVTFPETLDLSPYTSDVGDGSDIYKLYAVVVHIDMLNASFFGHYICYIKDFQGNWYRIDDWKVKFLVSRYNFEQHFPFCLMNFVNVFEILISVFGLYYFSGYGCGIGGGAFSGRIHAAV